MRHPDHIPIYWYNADGYRQRLAVYHSTKSEAGRVEIQRNGTSGWERKQIIDAHSDLDIHLTARH